jgi:menaquinone-dependent protoporphyrinogen oxidase
MARIGFVYSTVDGHTLEICERLVKVVEARGHTATLVELTPDSKIDLQEYDRVVIGASIRYGKHRPEVTRFINENTQGRRSSQETAHFSP